LEKDIMKDWRLEGENLKAKNKESESKLAECSSEL
jgi:hypothetical protein